MSHKRKHRSDELWSRRRDSYHVVEPGKPINGKGYSDGRLALIAAQVRLEKGIGRGGSCADSQSSGVDRNSSTERPRGMGVQERVGNIHRDKHDSTRLDTTDRLIVVRQSLFGPAVPLWEVYREDSAICTLTLNRED